MDVLLVEPRNTRSTRLISAMEAEGWAVARLQGMPSSLVSTVEDVKPDAIVIDADNPDDTLIHAISELSNRAPKPVILYVKDAPSEAVEAVLKAGVSAFVIEELDPRRIGTVMKLAIFRFEERMSLKKELSKATALLENQKVITRAKAILMAQRGICEDDAHQAMRRMAMDRKIKMAALSQQIIEAAELLG